MNQRTWPNRSDYSQFKSFPLSKSADRNDKVRFAGGRTESSSHSRRRFHSTPSPSSDFSMLPFDVLNKIASTFPLPALRDASLVCKSWSEALRPLREAMQLVFWGKRFKHGKAGVQRNLEKAMNCFLKGAERGSTLAMVDAGLLYWEQGKKKEAVALYRRAAELGDPTGQCNLGISILQDQPQNAKEAIKLLYQASFAGHARAQFQLALCLHRGVGLNSNLQQAARWYLKAAEGGYVRAMYNTALCFSLGEGFPHSHRKARKWMKQAADHGHTKAQFEHGLALFSEQDMARAAVYLELASRAGETAAVHVRNAVFQQLSPASQTQAMLRVDSWKNLSSSR